MPPTDVSAAANSRLVERVEYTIDPRGWAMFGRLSSAHARGITGHESTTPPVVPRVAYWSGALHTLQRFTGAGNLGRGRPVTETTAELADGRSDGLSDPGMRLFAERAARRRL